MLTQRCCYSISFRVQKMADLKREQNYEAKRNQSELRFEKQNEVQNEDQN